MKIYFAYRSAYIPNLRHVKVFEGNSILSWFQENWSLLADENQDLLGTYVYGFASFDESKMLSPQNISDLKDKISKYVYSNEVLADEHCLQVFTDDDEIGLVWQVFDEEFARANMDMVSLWLNESLPVDFALVPNKKIKGKATKISPKGSKSGTTYFLFANIYDGDNLADGGAYKIEGLRLSDLPEYFRTTIMKCKSEEIYYTELQFVQRLFQLLLDSSSVYEALAKYSIPEALDYLNDLGMEVTDFTMDVLSNAGLRNTPEKSIVNTSEHLVEISVNSLDIFYNYIIIFDDLWMSKHSSLAKSMIHFFEGGKLI